MDSDLPELKKTEVDRIVDYYKAVYESEMNVLNARVLVKRRENNFINIIYSEWTQRNLKRGTMMKISRSFIADKCFATCVEIDSCDISDCVLSSYSKSGYLKAIIRKIRDENGMKYFLEIWTNGKIKTMFDLTAIGVHGNVYEEGNIFASLCWSKEENKVAYIAEEKSSKTSPFFPPQSFDKSAEKVDQVTNGMGDQFVYDEDWGEMREVTRSDVFPKRNPVIVVCDVNEETVTILQGVPKNVSAGQVIWRPYDGGIIGVGYIKEPRKMGLLDCSNRKSHIFHLTNTGEYTIISDENQCAYSPRLSPTGKYLVWLQRPHSGTIHAAQRIVKYHCITQEKTILVDIIQDKILTKNGKDFFGVYCCSLPSRCWSSKGKYLFFSTPQKNRVNTYVVNTENSDIWDIGAPKSYISTIFLDVTEDNYILFNTTSYKQPPVLSSLYFPMVIEKFTEEFLCPYLTESVSESNMLITNFTVFSEKEKKETCYATYYGPRSSKDKSIPLLLYLHGGPHSSVSSVYTPVLCFFARLAYGIVIVNYRGSHGYGQNYIDSLVGNIGSMDVDDCYSAAITAAKKFSWLDPNRIVVMGGSHGGYIATHLTSQYPNDIKAIATRNPLVDVYMRCFLSHIPDWSFVENGFPYEGLMNLVDNEEIRKKMMDVSPMKNVKNVKTPTLLLLGKRDGRIQPGPAIAYYHVLKEMGVPAKVLFYEDNHLLLEVPIEMDSAINSAIWFKRSLKKLKD